ncbi:hypothetical protein LLG95_04420 [bacterium]|nr:hypothetical protein [bacterium]
MKRLILIAICACLFGSMAYAVNINVGAGSSIQTAINGASDGDTITLTSSALYKENLRISKSIKLVAATGQNPVIEQADNTTTAPVILGVTASPANIQIGSLTGGRIIFQYLKWGFGTAATMPVGHIYMGVTTGSTVLIENCDITSTGPTTYGPVSGIAHHQNPASVTLRYVNMNLNRADYAAGGTSANRVGCTGIDISNNSPTGGSTITRRIPGPSYTLDHVRIKGYVRAGLWLHYTSMTLACDYVDVGTFNENMLIQTANIPWGPLVAFNGSATWTGRIQNSIFQGPRNYAAFGKIGPDGTSITLSRTVILGSGGTNLAYGALDIGTQSAAPTAWPVNKLNVTIDHCDLVHLGATPASALVKASVVANSNMNVRISNSNIYSQNARAINITTTDTTDVYVFNNNNIYGALPNTGFSIVSSTNDISYDPLYFDAMNGDMRYYNNTLKTADSVGGPIGTNGGYGDVYNGIIAGNPGVINRAHGWTVLK